MSATVRSRRRWWCTTAIVALILASAVIAWIFRPLNTTERSLVGTWEIPDPERTWNEQILILRRDRAFVLTERSGQQAGTWSAGGLRVELHYQPDDPEMWDRFIARARDLWEGRTRSRRFTFRWGEAHWPGTWIVVREDGSKLSASWRFVKPDAK